MGSETHAGEDVLVYAQGPWAHLFHGTHEQSYIAHVIKHAACIGDDQTACEPGSESAADMRSPVVTLLWTCVIAFVFLKDLL